MGVEICDTPKVLKEYKHFAVPLKQDGRMSASESLELRQPARSAASGTKLDVLFQVEDDPYSRKRGYASWSLSLKDIRLAD